jgi:predicted ester cyclase
MKKRLVIFGLVIAFCLAVDCQNNAATAKLEAMKAQSALAEQNKEVVKRWLAEYDKGNFGIVDEIIAEDCLVHYAEETYDREWLRATCEAFPKSFSDSVHMIEDLIAEKDKVVARAKVRVTHAGEFMGVAPTGKTVEYGGYTLYRLEGGMIRELWMDQNATLELMKKLGIRADQGETL